MVVAVDPAKEDAKKKKLREAKEGTDAPFAETGIVVVARDGNGRAYVLEDLTLHGSPEEWGRVAVRALDEWDADLIVYEANQGGEMVAAVLRGAAKSLKEDGLRSMDFIPLKDVHATRGKYVRAEPISQLYEQRKVHHVGLFPELEDQLCEYTPDGNMGYSPDRMDALVWGLTELMIGSVAYEGLLDYYQQESRAVKDRLTNVQTTVPTAKVALRGPGSVNVAFGRGGDRYDLGPDGFFHVKEADVGSLQTAGFVRHLPLPS